ncbi:MAG: hypothetical protein ACPLPS_10370 [bacterium]
MPAEGWRGVPITTPPRYARHPFKEGELEGAKRHLPFRHCERKRSNLSFKTKIRDCFGFPSGNLAMTNEEQRGAP